MVLRIYLCISRLSHITLTSFAMVWISYYGLPHHLLSSTVLLLYLSQAIYIRLSFPRRYCLLSPSPSIIIIIIIIINNMPLSLFFYPSCSPSPPLNFLSSCSFYYITFLFLVSWPVGTLLLIFVRRLMKGFQNCLRPPAITFISLQISSAVRTSRYCSAVLAVKTYSISTHSFCKLFCCRVNLKCQFVRSVFVTPALISSVYSFDGLTV
jgi:hypothetical protein